MSMKEEEEEKKSPLSGGSSSTAKELAVHGKNIFDKISAPCHGVRGEGKLGPAIIGPKSKLVKYKTAKGLLDFISELMPMDNPGSLKPEEYLAVMSFLLLENKLVDGEIDMKPDQLEKIKLG